MDGRQAYCYEGSLVDWLNKWIDKLASKQVDR